MAINWKDIFRGVGAGLEYAADTMKESRIDEREEAQAAMRAGYMDKLERRRQKDDQNFRTKLAREGAKTQFEYAQQLEDMKRSYDNFGLTITREQNKVRDLPEGSPEKTAAMDRLNIAMNLLAEAKGGRTDFQSEELADLPADFRVNFTGLIFSNKQVQEKNAREQGLYESLLATHKAQQAQSYGLAQYYGEGGQRDSLKHLQQYQAGREEIAKLKSGDMYTHYERMRAEGSTDEEIKAQMPTVWKGFHMSNDLIRTQTNLNVKYGLLGGMSPEELGLVGGEEKLEPEPEPTAGKKERTDISPLWAVESAGKKVGEKLSATTPVRALEKAISPIRVREKDLDAALKIGLKRARKEHGNSVMSYEQAMDLKENRPGAAKGQRFVAYDPATKKVRVFEFIIKEGRLSARKIN